MKAKRAVGVVLGVALVAVLLAALSMLPAVPTAAQSGNEIVYVVLHSGTITNGNGTAVSPINVPAAYDQLTVQVSGVVSGTVNWEATINGSTWVAVPATNVNTGNAATTATAASLYRFTVTGFGSVRARVSGIITNTTDSIDVAGWLTTQ